jgi:nitrous oxidase accessory protein
VAVFGGLGMVAGAWAGELHVGTGQAHASPHAAVAAAAPGDRVVVHGGVYRGGTLRIDKPLTLIGIDRPVLDGEGRHEVLAITASRVSVKGFLIHDGGISSLEDFAGIKVAEAAEVLIEDNRIERCQFAVHLARAKDCRITGNTIRGRPGSEHSAGNGIHLWSCERITVGGNTVQRHRDGIYLEFATDSRIERNVVEDNLRYGLHFMFSHRDSYHDNEFRSNGAGVAVMYSREVEMIDNRFDHNWGSSAYGLLLKEMSGGRIAGNTFERNTVGILMDGSNRMQVEDNRFLENGWAIRVQTNCSDNRYTGNDFSGNSFDVAADGALDNNRFEDNYWEKNLAYDIDRDGTGDVPYRPVSLYALVVERIPSSVLLLRSPVVHLLEQAEKAFPSITPESVLDERPAMRPHR